jgi:hypothetical protein
MLARHAKEPGVQRPGSLKNAHLPRQRWAKAQENAISKDSQRTESSPSSPSSLRFLVPPISEFGLVLAGWARHLCRYRNSCRSNDKNKLRCSRLARGPTVSVKTSPKSFKCSGRCSSDRSRQRKAIAVQTVCAAPGDGTTRGAGKHRQSAGVRGSISNCPDGVWTFFTKVNL